MVAFLKLLILAPIAVLVILLAMANRTPVMLSFDPVGGDGAMSVTVPLFVAVLGALMLGILIGGIVVWLGQGKHRRAARHALREAENAKAEAERLRQLVSPAAAGGAPGLPASMIR